MDIVPQNPNQQRREIERAGALRAEQITEGADQSSNFHWFRKNGCKDLMVVASLIATVAFQAGLIPPGGTWQDDLTTDSNGNPVPNPHRAGESIMAYQRLHFYKFFLRFNTTAFVSSLGTILLLITGLPFKNDIFMWILRIVMWLTATSIALTYGFSIAFVTPGMDREQLGHVIEVAIGAWSTLITLILIGNLGYSMNNWWQRGRRVPCSGRRGNHQDVENQANGRINQITASNNP